MSYVLILTMSMFAGQYNALSSSQAIEHVPGFTTMEECQQAGNAWLRQQRAIRSQIHRREVSALCIRRADTKKAGD